MAEVTSTHVVAQFKYSYEYEGKTVSFKKGEIFQLLNTSNKDWWQVRRWLENGTCENLYVPANYMKIKEQEGPSHVYQNMSELQEDYKRMKQQMEEKKEQLESSVSKHTTTSDKKAPPPTQPKTSPKLVHPKPHRKQHGPAGGGTANGHPGNKPHSPHTAKIEPEYAIPNSPSSQRKPTTAPTVVTTVAPSSRTTEPPHLLATSGPIAREWQPGYALPMPKKQRSNTTIPSPAADTEETSLDVGPRKLVPGIGNHLQQLELTFSQQMNSVGSGSHLLSSSVPTSTHKIMPEVKPKPVKDLIRPKSYCIDDENSLEVSTFKVSATSFGIPEEPFENNFAQPKVHKSYTRPDYSNQGVPPSLKTQTSGSAVSGTPKPVLLPQPISLPSTPVTPPIIATASPTPSPVSPLPEGWSEHRTADGRAYYYNSFTKESKWTPPTTPAVPQPSTNPHLEKVAPRGWTKEINPITQTPIYTNCRTRERWALAKDDRGYYYYNTNDTSQRLRDLPAIDDLAQITTTTSFPLRSTSDNVNIYDHLTPVELIHKRGRTLSEDDTVSAVPKEHMRLEARSSNPIGVSSSQEVDMWSSRLSSTQKKHGYLQRKRLVEPGGKRVKNDKWMKLYVVLQDNQLLFYSDHRTKDHPGVKPVFTFNLVLSNITMVNLKDKKKVTVIMVSSVSSEQFYLQAETSTLLNNWYATLQGAIDQVNMDYKDNPDKYDVFLSSLEATDKSDSPPTQIKFPNNRKASLPRGVDDEDPEELELLSGAEKTVRIKGRLRNLIARRPQVEVLKKSGIMQDSVFGCELSHLTEREHRMVPQFFTHLIEHIEKKGLHTVGIYRLSGNAAQVQKLRYLVEEDPLVNLSSPEWNDINIITGCLKLYLRELPDPLIPFRHFRFFIDAAKTQPNDKKLLVIKSEVDKLPTPNYHTLCTLVKHLRKIVEHGQINKMFANNLGIVFGPTVMRAEVDSIEMATLMPVQNNLMETFITEFEKIFRK